MLSKDIEKQLLDQFVKDFIYGVDTILDNSDTTTVYVDSELSESLNINSNDLDDDTLNDVMNRIVEGLNNLEGISANISSSNEITATAIPKEARIKLDNIREAIDLIDSKGNGYSCTDEAEQELNKVYDAFKCGYSLDSYISDVECKVLEVSKYAGYTNIQHDLIDEVREILNR